MRLGARERHNRVFLCFEPHLVSQNDGIQILELQDEVRPATIFVATYDRNASWPDADPEFKGCRDAADLAIGHRFVSGSLRSLQRSHDDHNLTMRGEG
jgi:hypothetical protein